MNAGGRLLIYGAGLAVAFAGAFVAAGVVVPDRTVQAWQAQASDATEHKSGADGPGGASGDAALQEAVSMSSQGYVLSQVSAPSVIDQAGQLAYTITGPDGHPVTDYQEGQGSEMHLVVVRTDGAQYRHVHPELDSATGTWSLPWEWSEAGTYKLYANVAVAGDREDPLILSRSVDVAGTLTPHTDRPVSAHDEVDGYEVTLAGDLKAGTSTTLTLSVTQDGVPVTALQPYLGAFGHLVALREGDLEYLHVHAEGEEPSAGDTSGPDVSFMAEAPTAGRYFLYLTFRVDGEVHTAQFVLEAEQASGAKADNAGEHSGGH